MENNEMLKSDKDWKFTFTVATFFIGILFYTVLVLSSGVVVGMLVARQSWYIQHYHGADVDYLFEGNTEIRPEKKVVKRKTSKRRKR